MILMIGRLFDRLLQKADTFARNRVGSEIVAFFFTSNVPKLCTEMAFPSCNCCVISDSKDAISSDVSFMVYPNLRDNSEVNSLLFKIQLFL